MKIDRFFAISKESPMQNHVGQNRNEEFVLNRIHQKLRKLFN